MSKIRELIEEFRTVVAGRSNLLDSILPPTLFLLANGLLGFDYALWGALSAGVLITVLRLWRRQPLGYALAGLGAAGLAILISRLLGRAEGYFLPGMLGGGLTAVLCLVSVLVRRPLVAWTSYITRRWPLDWYWHPRVRPAYSEVTWLWTVFFGLRLWLQFRLFQGAEAGLLALVQLLTGWPATIVLLVITYLYGIWRLGNLEGPSVEEFKAGALPPWEGQRRGF